MIATEGAFKQALYVRFNSQYAPSTRTPLFLEPSPSPRVLRLNTRRVFFLTMNVETELESLTKKLSSLELAKRPSIGKGGKAYLARVNCFNIAAPRTTFYQFDGNILKHLISFFLITDATNIQSCHHRINLQLVCMRLHFTVLPIDFLIYCIAFSPNEERLKSRRRMEIVQKLQLEVAPELFRPQAVFDGKKNLFAFHNVLGRAENQKSVRHSSTLLNPLSSL